MNTTYDYIHWRGDLPFSKCPLTEIDALIFALLSNIEYISIFETFDLSNQILLPDLVKKFENNKIYSRLNSLSKFERQNLKLLKELCIHKRYSTTKLFGYRRHFDEKNSIQFSAISFILEDESIVLSFRGTDSSLVGWKEDFAMSFKSITGAQRDSLDYLNDINKINPRMIITCGHSKGGNLAVYSALKASKNIKNKILKVYNFDGPGFNRKSVNSKEFKQLSIDKITTIVPQSSIVGILMLHEEPIQVVYSSNKTGIFQHYPLSWEVDITNFKRLEGTDNLSKNFDTTTRLFLESISDENMEKFTDALFEMFHEKGALTFKDVVTNPVLTISTMHDVHKKIPNEYKYFLEKLGKAMLKASLEMNRNTNDSSTKKLRKDKL